MIKEFNYTSTSGTKSRRVFVIKENEHYIAGIDLNLLPEDDAKLITDIYKDVMPTDDFKAKVTLENFNPNWNKAYRQFSKNRIIK